jgi:hypothetical protein
MKGLKMSLSDITTFYRIWDEEKVVLKMTKGYYYNGVTDQIN